jgi:hypothetical protein
MPRKRHKQAPRLFQQASSRCLLGQHHQNRLITSITICFGRPSGLALLIPHEAVALPFLFFFSSPKIRGGLIHAVLAAYVDKLIKSIADKRLNSVKAISLMSQIFSSVRTEPKN